MKPRPEIPGDTDSEEKDLKIIDSSLQIISSLLFAAPERAVRRRAQKTAEEIKKEKEAKAAAEESLNAKKELPFLIDHFFKSPAHLAEFAPEAYQPITALGSLPSSLISHFAGESAEEITQLLTDDPAQQKEISAALNRLRSNLIHMAEEHRKHFHELEIPLGKELTLLDAEHADLNLFDEYDHLSDFDRARITTTDFQYHKAGYFIAHQSPSEHYRLVETHMHEYQAQPQGVIKVFPEPVSMNTVRANPLCMRYGMVTVNSLGVHSTVSSYLMNGLNWPIMASINTTPDDTFFQEHAEKVCMKKTAVTADIDKYDETKNADISHALTQSSRKAMKEGIFNHLPSPQSFVVPENYLVVVITRGQSFIAITCQSNQDEQIVSSSDDGFVTRYKSFTDGSRIVHGGKNMVLDAKNNVEVFHHILVYVPANKKGGELQNHHIGIYGNDSLGSCSAFLVKADSELQISALIDTLRRASDKDILTLTNKCIEGQQPLFSIDPMTPFVGTGRDKNFDIEWFNIHFDGEATYLNLLEYTLSFKYFLGSGGGLAAWKKLIIEDINPMLERPVNKEYRKLISSEVKQDMSGYHEMEILAARHKDWRAITEGLIDARIACRNLERLVAQPALFSYNKQRLAIFDEAKEQLFHCYIRSELERDMKDHEQKRLEQVELRRQRGQSHIKQFSDRADFESIKKLEEKSFANYVESHSPVTQLEDYYQIRLQKDLRFYQAESGIRDSDQLHRFVYRRSMKQLIAPRLASLREHLGLDHPGDQSYLQQIKSLQDNPKMAALKKQMALPIEQILFKKLTNPDASAELEKTFIKEQQSVLRNQLADEIKLTVTRMQLQLKGDIMPSTDELEACLIDYLCQQIKSECLANMWRDKRELFRGKIPVNPVDLTDPALDVEAELAKLAGVKNSIIYRFDLQYQHMQNLLKNENITAKLNKYTLPAFSYFKMNTEEKSSSEITVAARLHYR